MALEEHPGTWTHDPEAKASYVYLRGSIAPGGVARTVTADSPMVNFDLDENGRVIGIEILAAWPGVEGTLPDDQGVTLDQDPANTKAL
ncbi:DUF2283 domain-containing protein [Nonomuraea sp. NPDC049419]|uniref:DUF2283 domain-containing protein n=1 Tax=Nonomuraea sp. NPDC049419 TaxID=3155772 RepID=UPI003424221A